MPRKKLILKKTLKPDPIFNSTVVSRFTNMIMSDGKKRTAEKIIYAALEIMGEKNILNKLPTSASNLYAKNVFNFLINLYDKENNKINVNLEDEIIEKTLIK